jgi:hypothetical protein
MTRTELRAAEREKSRFFDLLVSVWRRDMKAIVNRSENNLDRQDALDILTAVTNKLNKELTP